MVEHGLKIKKIWSDAHFFELRIVFTSNNITLTQDIYTDNDALMELRRGIMNFSNELGNSDYRWISGNESATHYLSLRFFLKNRRGIVGIEVDVDNNLDPPDRIVSKFYLTTEPNQLDVLTSRLQSLINGDTGEMEALILPK
ncbi:hypothetical protein [Aquibacillus kalidii]|uniref:hypothetical protein n=1 Tax=Aquibacillus kalidii TaxID=2762597 RepID=UPI0016497816|nr:hypothetical protein [Aquibacillus kalidii]